jgi:hypothetical protein
MTNLKTHLKKNAQRKTLQKDREKNALHRGLID